MRSNSNGPRRPKTRLLVVITALGMVTVVRSQTAVVTYEGTAVNTLLEQDATMTMTVWYWPDDSVSGTVDFDELPGQPALCGAGNFTGHQVGDSLFHSFISHDDDAGCTFDDNIVVYLFSGLYNDLDSISGEYQGTETPGVEGAGYYNLRAVWHTSVPAADPLNTDPIVMPNPTTGAFRIVPHPVHRIASVVVRNSLGLSVLERSGQFAENAVIELPELAHGVYLVEVRYADGKRRTERMVKE